MSNYGEYQRKEEQDRTTNENNKNNAKYNDMNNEQIIQAKLNEIEIIKKEIKENEESGKYEINFLKYESIDELTKEIDELTKEIDELNKKKHKGGKRKRTKRKTKKTKKTKRKTRR